MRLVFLLGSAYNQWVHALEDVLTYVKDSKDESAVVVVIHLLLFVSRYMCRLLRISA
jgi:hypothetical protein